MHICAQCYLIYANLKYYNYYISIEVLLNTLIIIRLVICCSTLSQIRWKNPSKIFRPIWLIFLLVKHLLKRSRLALLLKHLPVLLSKLLSHFIHKIMPRPLLLLIQIRASLLRTKSKLGWSMLLGSNSLRNLFSLNLTKKKEDLNSIMKKMDVDGKSKESGNHWQERE